MWSIRIPLFVLVSISPIGLQAVDLGHSEQEVIQLHGEPSSRLEMGRKKVLIYPAGKVTLESNKVIDVVGDLDAKAPPKPKLPKANPQPVAKTPKHLLRVKDHLVDGNNKRMANPDLAEKKYTLFYYSASWCGPCRSFTPKLVRFYNRKKKANNFEIIFSKGKASKHRQGSGPAEALQRSISERGTKINCNFSVDNLQVLSTSITNEGNLFNIAESHH